MESAPQEQSVAPRWQPLSAHERRVVGVLVEKAKTTPDIYPMSVNALVSGSNQKNNRDPLMQLESDDVEVALETLRRKQAVVCVQGGGRVERFRHCLYEWLGVDKAELAVMAELLLRGAQTEGELRGRAARMEPIADVSALRPILDRLKAKGLVLSLTPEGRGHVVTHALYQPQELEKVKRNLPVMDGPASPGDAPSGFREPAPSGFREPAPSSAPQPRPVTSTVSSSPGNSASRDELAAARQEIRSLRQDVDELKILLSATRDEVERLKSALGV